MTNDLRLSEVSRFYLRIRRETTLSLSFILNLLLQNSALSYFCDKNPFTLYNTFCIHCVSNNQVVAITTIVRASQIIFSCSPFAIEKCNVLLLLMLDD
jgi:hypothetical protein